MLTEKFPTKDKIVDEILDNSAIGAQESTLDAKLDIDGAYRLYFTTVYANGFALVWLDLVLIKCWMTTKQTLAYARSLTTCVAKGRTGLPIHVYQDLSLKFWFQSD